MKDVNENIDEPRQANILIYLIILIVFWLMILGVGLFLMVLVNSGVI